MDARYLDIYLNDHLAAGAGLLALLDRPIGSDPAVAPLRPELEEDQQALKALAAANGVRIRRPRLAGGWLAEKAGRLKFNGHLLRRSPLSPLVELEGLALGLGAKEWMWRTLGDRAADHAAAARCEELAGRAQRQRAAVEARRAALAAEGLPEVRTG